MATGLGLSCYDQIVELTAAGKSVGEIAAQLGVGRSTVHAARRRGAPATWDEEGDRQAPPPSPPPGPGYTCDACGHRRRAEPPLAPFVECKECGGLAYPPMSDAEVYRRVAALVKRLEAEDGAG
jgi:hypothetical protein